MEYYPAIKNDEFVSFVGTQMNLETIILSKLMQEQKIKHHVFSLIGMCWTLRTRGHREGRQKPTDAGEAKEKKEFLHTVGGNVH